MDTCLCECEPDADVPMSARKSVHVDCIKDEELHKWLASERAGRDLGEEAIWHWLRSHWHGYLRARWVEHLQGKYFWIELQDCDYGLLRREFHDQRPLLDAILNRLAAGEENLPIVCWAIDKGFDCDHVRRILDILTALDVNSSRLKHRFEQPPPPVEPIIVTAQDLNS